MFGDAQMPSAVRSESRSPRPVNIASPADAPGATVAAPPVRLSGRLLTWSVTSALAGFLFGFDTVVISGAEQTIQSLWGLSAGMHGLALGAALYGTVLGSLVGGWPADRFGRKATLTWIGVLYIVSAVGCGVAWNVWVFILARFLGGVGIGISTVAAPLYISEIAPPRHRGRLAGMFQFNIVFGIVVAFASNALLSGVGENAWRWMLGVAAFPSVVYTLMCLGIPESPRWLLTRRGDRAAGLKDARPHRTRGHPRPARVARRRDRERRGRAAQHARLLVDAAQGPDPARLPGRLLQPALGDQRDPLLRPAHLRAHRAWATKAALLQSVGIGITNLVFTFVGLWLIDRLGRRTLLYIGSFGYIASLGLCAWAFFTQHYSIVPACIFAFIAAHAIGQGTVIWVLISEIFPNQFRASGQSLGSATHWVFAALLTTVFPYMVSAMAPGYIFSFFCGMMVLQLVWVATMVPETKGVPLEEIQKQLGVVA
jgi:SP family arabinose:H+ symporter-like MFS transporter